MSRTAIACTVFILASLQGGKAQANTPVQLPYRQAFDEASVPDGWAIEKSEGTDVMSKDGFLIFQSHADRPAIVKHMLGVDDVTITARIHGATSVYVVWKDEAFVGAGKVSPTPFARFHTVLSRDGKILEKDHTGCNGGSAHLVRIQLGIDCIRFQYSAGDGEPRWRTLRTIERTPEYAGTPKFVAVGKNLGITQDASMLVNTDSVGRGNSGSLVGIEIVKTPTEALKMSTDERRRLTQPKLDPVAELLKESDSDPTFDEVARFYPEMKNKRDLVGVPGQRNDIGTDWLGRIDASPWEGPVAWFEIGEAALPFADTPSDISHRLLDGYVPIVKLHTTRDHTDYEMTVFGWADNFSPTSDLYTYVRLTGWAEGDTANLPKSINLAGKGELKIPFATDISPSGMMTVCLRFKHPDPKTAEKISLSEFEAHRQQTETAWRDVLAQCAPFELPDPRVNEAYRAWLAYSMLNADRIDGRLHVHDGAGFYDLQYGYSVALHSMALDLYRLPDYVADMLATQVYYQQPDGHYIQECGLPDQGGFALALARHYLITKDRDWLQQNAVALIKACDWIIARRTEAPSEGVCKGLIKFRPYNDYNDAVFNYQGNIYCCQGLEAAAIALDEIGDTEHSKLYVAEATRYRQDIFDSMDKATFTHNGIEMIPVEPDTQRLLKLTKYRGGEYYGLVASTLFENDFFPINDPHGALFRNMLENQGGLAAGVCEFQEGIDHAYTCGYLMDRMRAGEIRKVLLGFWSFFAYGMTRDTYSPVEVTLYKTGDNHYTLPHTYSCTQQLRLLRCMLLREEGESLVIAQGIPSAWLEPSKIIEVDSAPTLFGPVSYRFDAKDSTSIQLHLEPPTRNPPQNIVIHFRHPQGKAIGEVTTSQHVNPNFANQSVSLSATTRPVDLVVKFEE